MSPAKAAMPAGKAAGLSLSHDVPYQASFGPSSSTQSFFDLPGLSLYLSDPHRLSVLSLSIDASSTISTLPPSWDLAPDTSTSTFDHPASASPAGKADKTNTPTPYQRLRRLSGPRRNSQAAQSPKLFSAPTIEPAPKGNARPKSVEIGLRAKGAFNELGRLARGVTGGHDRSPNLDALSQVAHNLVPEQGSSRRSEDHYRPSPTSATPASVEVRRRTTVKPQSFTFGRDSRLASCVIPLDVELKSSVIASHPDGSPLPSDSKGKGTLQMNDPVEFVADPNPFFSAPRSAGEFSAASSDSGEDPRPPASSQADRHPFDPTRLLLKVQPPIQAARQLWLSQASSSAWPDRASARDELHQISLCFRLRLCASAKQGNVQVASRTGTSTTPASGLGEVLFISADSSQKLVDAIDLSSSALASKEAAALEGLSREVVNPAPGSGLAARGARECDFEWKWKPLNRSQSGGALSGKGAGTGKCCCAFVEMDPSRSKVKVLAAFNFWIEMPNAKEAALDGLETRQPVLHSDSIALIAALNHDIDRPDLFDTAPSPLALSKRRGSSLMMDDKGMYLGSPALQKRTTLSAPLDLSINHTEISLDDVENDSPILRAAIANLEKRTTTLKRTAKAVMKAATDTRFRILGLMESEDALENAMKDLGVLAPDTVGRLQQTLSFDHAQRLSRHRREQATMIEQNIERPLFSIVELCRSTLEKFKIFEGESKTFYSQTQKWLSNRAVLDSGMQTTPATQQIAGSDGADKLQKQERSDEKQKLRQLRFEHARLDLYRALFKLHGGDVELELLQHMLKLSKWQTEASDTIWGQSWPDARTRATMDSISVGLDVARKQHEGQVEGVRQRAQELEDRIHTVETILRKAGDGTTDQSLATDAYQQNGQATEFDVGPAKAAGHKIRNFFGALGKGMNSSPAVHKTGKDTSPLDKENGSHDVRRKVSMKRVAERLQGGRSEGAKAESNSVLSSSTEPRPNLTGTGTAETGSRNDPTSEASELMKPTGSAQEAVAMSPGLSTGETQVASGTEDSDHQRTEAPADKNLGLGIGVIMESSAKEASSAAPNSNKPTLPGQDRKKEGVLWVMSKPVTGPAGSDAPKAVSRAAHWRECWVVLSGSGHICEYADWKDAKILEPSNPLIDLRFATVREARGVDRRFTFEVVTRDSRRFFQAPDEAAMKEWTRAIARAIESLLNGTSSVRKLDRAVRATPFSNDWAKGAGALTEEPALDEFASGATNGLGRQAFSQSMTDLVSSGKKQPEVSKAAIGKGAGRRVGGHLSTLSESYTSSGPQIPPEKLKRSLSKHERGISNKTPISGYLQGNGSSLGLDAQGHNRRSANQSDTFSSTSSEFESDFDRRIEEIVHNSYGRTSSDGAAGWSQPLSPTVSEMGAFQREQSAGNGKTNSTSQGQTGVQSSNSTKVSRAAEVAEISRRPENSTCADCRAPDPRWASWALGNQPCCIFICIACSGVHRSLGVQTSRVKSVDLDDWTEEQLESARNWGNAKANEVWEHSKPPGLLPAAGDRTVFWKTKYTDAAWKKPTPAPAAPAAAPVAETDPERTPVKPAAARPNVSEEAPRPRRSNSEEQKGPSSPRPLGPRPLPPMSRSSSVADVTSTASSHDVFGPVQASNTFEVQETTRMHH